MSLKDILNFLSTQRASIKQNGDRMSAQQVSNIYRNVLDKTSKVYRDELGKRINKGEYDYLEKAFPKRIGEGKKLGYRLKSRVNFLNASLKSKSKDIRARATVQKKKDGWIDAALAQINDNVFYLFKESKNADRDIPTDLTALTAHTLSNILKKAIKNTKVVIRTSQQRLDISQSIGSGEDTSSSSSSATTSKSSSSATHHESNSAQSSSSKSSVKSQASEHPKESGTTKVIWPSSNSSKSSQVSSKEPAQHNNYQDRLQRSYSNGRKPSMLDHVKNAFSGKIKHFFNTYDTQKAQHQNIQEHQSSHSNSSNSSSSVKSESNSNISSESATHVQHDVQSKPTSSSSSNYQTHLESSSNQSQSNDFSGINSETFASLSASASHSASVSVSAVASRTSASLSRANSISNSITASASISDILSRSSASASVHYSMIASASRSNSLSSASASLFAKQQSAQSIRKSQASINTNGAQQIATQSKSAVNNFNPNSISNNKFNGGVADDSEIRNSAINFFNKLSAYHHRIQTSYANQINEAQSVTNSYSSALIAQSFAQSMDLSKASSSANLAVISARASVKSSMTASTAQQLGIKDASVAAMRSSMMKSFNTTTDAIEANNEERTSVEKSSAVSSAESAMQRQNRTSMAVANYRTSQANSKATYYSNRAEFYSNALSMLDSYYGAKASQMARHAQEIGLTRNLADQKISNYHGKTFPKLQKMDDLRNYLNGVTPSQTPNNLNSNNNPNNHQL